MKNLQIKAFIFQLISFVILFLLFKILIEQFTNLSGIWISLTSFVIVTIIAPKFQSVNTNNGQKLYMKWIFMKGVREIK